MNNMLAGGKAMMATGAALLLVSQGSGTTTTGTPLTIENVATVFTGVALIWFGGQMLKMRDTVMKMHVTMNGEDGRSGIIQEMRLLRARYHQLSKYAMAHGFQFRAETDEVESPPLDQEVT